MQLYILPLANPWSIASSAPILIPNPIGTSPLQTNLADWPKAFATSKAQTLSFSSPKKTYQPQARFKDVTYVRFVCTYRPQKTEPNRTRMTAGGDRVNYPGEVSTDTAELTTVKALINSTLSKPKAKFCCFDVKNFYLGTPMDRPEYARIHRNDIPLEIIDAYNLEHMFDEKGFVYIRIERGMYGLPQAGYIANKQLEKFLGRHGYHKKGHTPGLWGHTTRPIQFALIVDDFGVEFERKEDADHLLAALKRDYESVSCDWTGTLFCGITLDWNYTTRTCDLSMPDYVAKALHEYQHATQARRRATTRA